MEESRVYREVRRYFLWAVTSELSQEALVVTDELRGGSKDRSILSRGTNMSKGREMRTCTGSAKIIRSKSK